MWRHYLVGKKFHIRIENRGMKNLFGKPTLNAKQNKWLKFLSEYDFKIKHINEKENQVVDALNRRSHEVHIAAINMYMKYLKYKIVATTNSDKSYLKIKEILQEDNFQQKNYFYELKEDAILGYKGNVYVLNSCEMKNVVLREIHNVPYSRYPGYQNKIVFVRSQYFW
jgi:hypothetical protein